MPSLSEKLRALGVKIGAEGLPSPALYKEGGNPYSIERVLDGSFHQTHQGEVFTVETRHPEGEAYGCAALAITASLHALGKWAGNPGLQDIPGRRT